VLQYGLEKFSPRRLSPGEQASALAVVLCEEFGTPFTFYDAASGQPLAPPPGERGLPGWEPAAVHALATAGQASVQPLPGGGYQIALPLYQFGQVTLFATTVLAAVAPAKAAQEREQARLQKWVQSVCARQLLNDQLSSQRQAEQEANEQVKSAWKVTLTLDRLIRSLRIHRQSSKNVQRVLQAAFELLDTESLVWVPQSAESPVIALGQGCLAPADCRQLIGALTPELERFGDEPFFCHQVPSTPWGKRYPRLRTLMAFAVPEQNPLGWVVAVNKKHSVHVTAEPHFRRGDAAVLTPFLALLNLQLRTSDRYKDLQDLLVGLTRSLTTALDAKDSYTFGHSERVARIAVELAREMGLKPDELSDVYLAGLLHDVGKIGVRDSILGKRGLLTPEEFEHVKRHVTIGYSILADLRQIRNLLPGVLYHHERYDGTGYPDGLAGQSIPLLARILAVADGYDAMSTARPFRAAIPCGRVEEILTQGSGKQWDSQVVDAFFRCRHRIYAVRQRGVGESLRQALDGALTRDDVSILGECSAAPASVF
jgi:HD-GYP domain-containing protein (c-di-GMP phosphodiesterase class II)